MNSMSIVKNCLDNTLDKYLYNNLEVNSTEIDTIVRLYKDKDEWEYKYLYEIFYCSDFNLLKKKYEEIKEKYERVDRLQHLQLLYIIAVESEAIILGDALEKLVRETKEDFYSFLNNLKNEIENLEYELCLEYSCASINFDFND